MGKMAMSDLPKGWAATNLSEVVIARKGKKPTILLSEKKDGCIPYILIDEMEGRPIRSFTNDISMPIASEKDILVVWDGSIGKTATGLKGAIGSTIAALTPFLVETAYLESFIKFSKPYIEQTSRGTGLQHINPDYFWTLQVPLAPLTEQRRIVEKLDRLLHKVNDSKERLEKIPAILKRFHQSVLAAACSGRLTADWREDDSYEEDLPTGWKWNPLEELLQPRGIFDGPFGSNLKTADYTDSGVRVVRLGNVGHLRFLGEKESFISREKYETLKKHTVGKGDIIFASFIDEEIRVCLLPKLSTTAIAKADCFCLRPKEDVVDRQYLTYQLVSRKTYNKLFEEVHGATRPRINTTQLRKLGIRICPLPEQKEIVRRVEALFKKADEIEARYKKAKAFVDRLTQSILAKAFRGELVPQDSDDEPASVLLERIREAKEKAIVTGKQTRRRKSIRSS
jgi:type I restriction enzyme S subunit